MIGLIENSRNEFKIKLTDDLEEIVIGFLNSKDGGNIYIGVKDNGEIQGLENNLDLLQRKIKDRIITNIEPSTLGLFDIEILENNEKKYIHITIARGSEKPYHIKGMGMTSDSCFIRIGSSTEKMSIDLINKQFRQRTKDSLKNIIAPIQNLTFTDLKIYYKEKGFDVLENFEKQLEFYTEDGKYNYVAYLLSDNNSVSIKVAKYAGNDVDELMENYEYGFCSLIKATDRVLEKLKMENKIYTKISYPRREEQEMYDFIAVRELVINAIVHNDWSNEYPPKFELFDNRIEISSFGGIQNEFTEEEFLLGYSAPKNKELMRVFKDLEFVEQLGTGIRKVLKKYDKNIYHFYPHFIRVSITYKQNKFKYQEYSKLQNKDYHFSKIQLEIMKLIADNSKITQIEMAKILNVTERTIRSNMKNLINMKHLKRIGSDKTGHWQILK